MRVREKITKASIERHLKNAKVTELKDDKTPLLLRINAGRTQCSCLAEYNKEGKTKRKKIGVCVEPFKNINAIRANAINIVADLLNDASASCDHFENVEQLLNWYIDNQSVNHEIKDSTKAGNVSAVSKHLIPKLGDLAIKELTPAALNDLFVQPMLIENKQLSTIQKYFKVLKEAFSRASDLKILEVNPLATTAFSDYIKTKILPKQGKLPTSKLVQTVAAIKLGPKQSYLYLMLMLCYGTRKMETANIRYDWFALEDKPVLLIPADVTKTKEPLTLPVTTFVLEAIADHQNNQKLNGYKGIYLFPENFGCMSDNAAHDLVLAVSKGEWTAHDLRKLARSCWAEMNVDYVVGEKLINHSLGKLGNTYIQTDLEERKRVAIENWHARLSQLLSAVSSDTMPTQPDFSAYLKSA